MKEIFSYDAMPYPSKFFLQTHPDRLASLATFFGMNPPDVKTCRVLELGCGNGSNLISHAFNLRTAKFVGVDLAENHIVDAKRGAEELNLENVEFAQMDVTKMSVEEFGKFDYIIAHGLFSWVPDFVREKVLALYREMLTENGIGYISYNAYPGAHSRDMVRRIMRFYTQNTDEPLEKVGKAISLLAFLNEHSVEKDSYRAILQSELKRHFEHEAADIYHDDLADCYNPFYFYEFADLLAQNDLQYLAEAELHAMSVPSFAPEVREFIEQFDTIIEREQYIDFLRGRIFRQTLFCHKDVELNRQVEPSVMNKFMLASSIRPQSENPEIASPKVERFVGTKGVGIEIDNPLTKAALLHLGNIWGRAIEFPKLLEEAKEILISQGFTTENWDEQFHIASVIFMQICLGTSFVELHLFQPDAPTEASEKPKVNELAKWQLPQAKNVTTLMNLDVKIEDIVSRHLLETLDGTRNREQLLTEMTEFIKSSDEIEEKQELLGNLSNWIDQSFTQLAKLGMFES